MPLISSLGRQRQEDLYEFKASLLNTASPRAGSQASVERPSFKKQIIKTNKQKITLEKNMCLIVPFEFPGWYRHPGNSKHWLVSSLSNLSFYSMKRSPAHLWSNLLSQPPAKRAEALSIITGCLFESSENHNSRPLPNLHEDGPKPLITVARHH